MRFLDNQQKGYYDNMELAKHGTTDENSVKRYISPKAKVIFVKAQNVLCVSPGNEPMREFDYGDAGFGEV